MTKEMWKDVVGYEGLYRVSSLGSVQSLPRKLVCADGRVRASSGKILLPYTCSGYPRVSLCKAGFVKKHRVHSLVCQAFHGPRPSKQHHVAHADGDPMNNNIENLRWATAKENAKDRTDHGRTYVGERHGQATLTDDVANMIRAAYRSGGYSQSRIAKMFKTTQATVHNIVAGKTWTHLPRAWNELA